MAEVEVAATWWSPPRLVTRLLMMGLLGSWVLTAPMALRRRAGIVIGNDVGVTGASGQDNGLEGLGNDGRDMYMEPEGGDGYLAPENGYLMEAAPE